MPACFWGIGSTLYGKRDFRKDGSCISYITTEWFIVAGFPLIPLRSYRVRRVGRQETGYGSSIPVGWGFFLIKWLDGKVIYKVYGKPFPPDLKQVIYTYGFFAVIPVWVWFTSSWFPSAIPHAFDSIAGILCLLAAWTIPALLPGILRNYALKRVPPSFDFALAERLRESEKIIRAPLDEPINQLQFWPARQHEPVAVASDSPVQEDKGRLDEAEAERTEAMQLAATFNKYGLDKKREGDFEGAIADFTRALQLKPDRDKAALVHYNRGSAKEANGDDNGAIEDYTKAIELNSQDTDVYNNRGYAKRRIGDLDGAIADFDKVIELKPDEQVAYVNRGSMKKEKGDLDGAIADLTKAIELKADNVRAYYTRGYARGDKGDLDGAIADFTKVIELNPNENVAYINRGSARKEKGDLDAAIADYTEAIQRSPDDALAYEGRSLAKRAKGDLDGANADHAKAAELLRRSRNQ